MLQNYSEDQLLQILQQRMGISTDSCGAQIVTLQGGVIDATLRERLFARYLNLLNFANPRLLPVRDISMQAAGMSTSVNEVGIVQLPDLVLRPVKVKLPEWPYAVTRFVEAATPEADQIRLNPYSRSTARPRIIRQDYILWLYNTQDQPRLIFEQLEVIMQPSRSNYCFDPRLLDIITDPEINQLDND